MNGRFGLNQFQAKESTEIPKDVYDRIIAEIKKNKIKNPKTITIPKMKSILRKLKLSLYYEHIPHIISKLTGEPPPTLSRDTEERVKWMFKAIQKPFTLFCPKDRTNFLSYAYVLHKFFEILGEKEFVKCFPLLKSREKLRIQDKIWEKICDYLGWQYYPSI